MSYPTTGLRPDGDSSLPQRSDAFAHLSLGGLRAYRRTLGIEETRVSYWRRIVQARIDLIRAIDTDGVPTVAALQDVFGEHRPASGRTVLLSVCPVDDLPPLPDLSRLWACEPRGGDTEHNAALARELGKVELQLSAYRIALHRRLEAATAELIARYREQPSLCLSALPLQATDERVNAL